jgi:hypothetical protein
VPRDDLELALMTIWERTLGALPAHVDADFFDEGGDSLLALDLCDQVRRDFGTEPNFNSFIMEPTFAGIVRMLRGGATGTSSPALVPLRSRGHKPPLFLLPGAGGNIFGYRRFVQHLDPDRPVYGLRYPDAGPAAGAALRIEDLAADLVAKVREVQPSHRRLLDHSATFFRLDPRPRREYLAARLCRMVEHCDRVVSRLTPGVRNVVPARLRAEFDWHRDASARYRPAIYPG